MTDSDYMQAALGEAQKGWGNVGTGALVGAVIVEDDQIVSRGHYEFFGGPHAEVNALRSLGRNPDADGTLYVTLEPCSSTGKTGPCTEAILESGIRNVVIGAIDPDQRHQGRGVDILMKAGISVRTGVLADDSEDLNLIFNHGTLNEGPFFAGKTATTLDGKIATRTGNSKWITGEAARTDVMKWRRYFPSIAVGAGTVIADNPSLTSRMEEDIECPVRFIFDRHLKTLSGIEEYQVFNDVYKERTVLVCCEGNESIAAFESHGIRTWVLPVWGVFFWEAFSKRCIQDAVTAVYFEGGAGLLSDLIAHRQLHYLFAYRAPKFLADCEAKSFVGGQSTEDMSSVYRLLDVKHAIFGDDQLMRGRIKYTDL